MLYWHVIFYIRPHTFLRLNQSVIMSFHNSMNDRSNKMKTKKSKGVLIAAIFVVGMIILVFSLSGKKRQQSYTPQVTVKSEEAAQTMNLAINKIAEPYPNGQFRQGPGLSSQEKAEFARRGPQQTKLYGAIAEGTHPYLHELVRKMKAMEVAIGIQVPPETAAMGSHMSVDAQFSVQMFSDGKTRGVIYVHPRLLEASVPDAFILRKLVHEYHHLLQWERKYLEKDTSLEVIRMLKVEIPAWIAECEYSVYELQYMKDETDICQGILKGGRRDLAQALAIELTEKMYNGKYRPNKADVIQFINSNEF